MPNRGGVRLARDQLGPSQESSLSKSAVLSQIRPAFSHYRLVSLRLHLAEQLASPTFLLWEACRSLVPGQGNLARVLCEWKTTFYRGLHLTIHHLEQSILAQARQM